MKPQGEQTMKRIAVTTTSFCKDDPGARKLLEGAGFAIACNRLGRKLTPAETSALLEDCCGVFAGTETYSRELMGKLKGLKVISRCGTGMDAIDLEAAKEMGITVLNTPEAPSTAVAELTLGLILALLRRIPESDKAVKEGRWQKASGRLLEGKDVGIVGMGRIGAKVAGLVDAFGARPAYFDIAGDRQSRFQQKRLDELLAWADIVTLHCSAPAGKPVIGQEEMAKMKKGAVLINTSRAACVDEKALTDALKKGALAGAGLDVFSEEPYTGELREAANVVLTPHIGSYAIESRIRMEREAAENLIAGLKKAGIG